VKYSKNIKCSVAQNLLHPVVSKLFIMIHEVYLYVGVDFIGKLSVSFGNFRGFQLKTLWGF
jgi:hypothetical protein